MPKDKKAKDYSVTMHRDEMDFIDKLAAENHLSRSMLIRMAVEDYFQRRFGEEQQHPIIYRKEGPMGKRSGLLQGLRATNYQSQATTSSLITDDGGNHHRDSK